jgi:hypothetical protein
MSNLVRVTALLGLIWFGGGCATFHHQSYHRGASPSAPRLVVLDMLVPRKIRVVNAGGVSGAFGLIGMVIGESEEQRKTSRFTDRTWDRVSDMGERMVQSVGDELRKSGYVVTRLRDRWPLQKGEVDDDDDRDYSQIAADADAILDLSFVTVGYFAQTADYRPWVVVRARMISMKDKSRLYAQEFSYGDGRPDKTNEHFAAEPGYAYRSFDALMDKADEASAGLSAAVAPIAGRISEQLR